MSHLPSRHQIAQRLKQGLLREIGHEIQVDRLLDDPRYARDVLLVCDALTDTDLAWLAPLFREATAAAEPADPAPGQPDEGPAEAVRPPERRRGWRQG